MRECDRAKVVRESGGVVVCGGLHKERGSFFLSDYDVIDECRRCGAWHMNWSEKQESKGDE